jgi:hypothetical protein
MPKFPEGSKIVGDENGSHVQFANGSIVKLPDDTPPGTRYEDRNGKIYKILPDGAETLVNPSTGGSRRRRRPSRKYKKSKRVLRRKSRSTRRR